MIVTSASANDQCFVQIYGNDGTVSATDNLSSSNLLNWSVKRTDGRGSNVLLVNSAVADIDSIRIGTTYADVATVPEPSTYALLGMGLAGVVAAVRRRKA